MRIRQLEIHGFKSFVDRVTFRFGEGISAIVGPNGCGKSNVMDAIKWVLGEQSPRNLRGQGMLDVIFNGSAHRAPVGLAEVTLTLSNAHGPFAGAYAHFSELQVTRCLHRSGESEYKINGLACRLRDIQDLFMDTGAGMRAYSIIEQGRVDSIVSARPEERRRLLEEAAGITRYKARRDEALRQLDRTQQNLDRVSDLLRELRRQLKSLERQAEKARQYQELRTRARLGDLVVALLRWGKLSHQRADARTRLEAQEQAMAGAAHAMTEASRRLEQTRARLGDQGRRVSRLREKLSRAEAAIQLHQNTLRLQGDRLRSIEQRKQEVAAEMAGRAQRLRLLERQQAEAGQRRDRLRKTMDDLEQRLAQVSERREAAIRTRTEVASRLDRGKRAVVGHLTAVARLRNSLINLERREQELVGRIERNQAELETLTAESARAEQTCTQTRHTLQNRKEALEAARDMVKGLEAERKRLIEERKGMEQTVARVRETWTRKRSRLDSLHDLERTLDGYGEGVRTLLVTYRGQGLEGTVADLIELPRDHLAAAEALLEHRLESVVARTLEDARDAVAFLQATEGGRATLVPRDINPPEPAPLPDDPAVIGAFLDLVPNAARQDPVVRTLLGGAALVDDVNHAIRLHRAGHPWTWVTPDGTVLAPDGSLSGGGGRGRGILHKKDEIRRLAAETARLEQAYDQAREQLESIRDRLSGTEADLESLREQHHAHALEVAETEQALKRAEADASRLQSQKRLRALDARSLAAQLEDLRRESRETAARLEAEEGARAAREEELATLEATVAQAGSEIDQIREEETRARLEMSDTRARHGEAERALKRLSEEIREATSAIARLEQRTKALTEEWHRADQEQRGAAAALEAARKEAAEARTELADLEADYAEAKRALAVEQSRLDSARSRHEEASRAVGRLKLEVSEIDLKLEHVRQGIEERFDGSIAPLWTVFGQPRGEVEESAARADPSAMVTLTDPDSGETLSLEAGIVARLRSELTPAGGESTDQVIARWESDVAAARRRLNRLGEVNLAAVEEYRTLEERTAFTEAQEEDLRRSVASIRAAIQRINRTSRNRFRRTFDAVNANFEEIFPKLFDGGSARLVLTDESNLLETGVDIIVQPPGKRLQNMNLLSGGEKAMAAIGLIFALFLVRPSPFCVLDEVDAPLDEVNSGRFHEVIQELARMSQFIVITHNKQTMEIADTLYGITMEEPGVSRLVTVDLKKQE